MSARARGITLTRRAIAVLVVLFILLFSYLNSLRVYLRQQQQISQTQVEIRERQDEIARLEDEKKRWQDPNYVKAQARSRLGWVVPGEVGYKVIGPDGKPLGGGAELDTEKKLPTDEHATTWWERLLGSIKAADEPTPAEQQPTSPPTVTPSTPAPTVKPSTPSASPSR